MMDLDFGEPLFKYDVFLSIVQASTMYERHLNLISAKTPLS